MTKIVVPLKRRFSPVSKDQDGAERNDYLDLWGYGNPIGWPEIDTRYRTVILAPGGAGKTHEMLERAEYLYGQHSASFFIRIEDIHANFETAFEVGDNTQFTAWLNSSEEGWFFLDSIDEARLGSNRAFEKPYGSLRAAFGLQKIAHIFAFLHGLILGNRAPILIL